jgi:Xaa-Pro dipeptidase
MAKSQEMMESVPSAELASRVATLKGWLTQEGITLALIRHAADLFYYTGALADGFLALSPAEEPLLLARRPQYRLLAAELPWPLAFYQELKEIPAILAQTGFAPQGALGLELDVLPAATYRGLKDRIFPGRPIKDLSPLIRRQRMVKSPYELEQLRRAAAVLDQAFEEIPALLKPGVSELEVAAALEYRLRLLGHQGLVRTRNRDLEMFYGHVLSGVSGLQAAYVYTPSGGPGLGPAFPQGAGLKKLKPGEPISIDLAACVHGYVADMTRMYAISSLPARAWEAWGLVTELYQLFVAAARPGVKPGDLHRRLWQEVRARGLEDCFMGQGADRVSFLAHGVGLELDEYPLVTARFPYSLAADMVLAFEPKLFLPEIGMIGLEDTGRITPDGVEWLTNTPREVVVL